MKNIIALMLFIIAVTLFISCGGGDEITADVSPEELMEAVITAYNAEDVPEALLFLSEAGEDQDEYLDPDRAGYFFYSEYGYDMADLYGMSSFALRIPTGNKVFEVCILLTTSRLNWTAQKNFCVQGLCAKAAEISPIICRRSRGFLMPPKYLQSVITLSL